MPYKLKCWSIETELIGVSNGDCAFIHKDGHLGTQKISKVKPILRPLSSLSNTHIAKLTDSCLLDYNQIALLDTQTTHIAFKNGINNRLSYSVVQKLLEWHFDIFGLIHAGLAIDINSL